MKPPIVHQPVQPPRGDVIPSSDDSDDAVRPSDEVAADDVRDVRYESTTRSKPGLVGDFGSLVNSRLPDFDIGPDHERRRH